MGRYIVKLYQNKYVHYSSVVDAPISYVMGREQTKAYMMQEDNQDEETVERRIARADKIGLSAIDCDDLSGVISCNRAGPKGETITLAQMAEMYASEEYYKKHKG